MDLQEAVKTAMKDKGLRQTVIAEKMGTNQSNLSMYLKSNMAVKVENLVRIANACGLDLILKERDGSGREYLIDGKLGNGRERSNPDGESFEHLVKRLVLEELEKRNTAPGSEE